MCISKLITSCFFKVIILLRYKVNAMYRLTCQWISDCSFWPANRGMPNLRIFIACLFQSTDKKKIYGRIYRFFLTWFGYYPRIYGFFRTEFGYYPPPSPTLDSAPSEPLRLCRVNFFGYYPKSHDFSEFRLGSPANTTLMLKHNSSVLAPGYVTSC